jgi:hypothetical protein
MPSHAAARKLAQIALQRTFGGTPTVGEVKVIAGVGWLETQYGTGWSGDGAGSNNIGAIHADPSWNGETFLTTDTKPTATGGSVSYVTRFKAYPTAIDGWMDLVRTAFIVRGRSSVRAAAQANDWRGVSQGLFDTGYYEGFGATEAERVGNHYKALSSAISAADGDASPAVDLPSLTVRVEDPQGKSLGTATLNEADAVGLMALHDSYGAPTLIAYPNGIRVLRFAPGILINARSNLPVEGGQKTPSFGWEHAAFVLSIAGLGATIFFGTLTIKPGRRNHAF